MKILITICARGGSKGIPGKNIRPLGGRPLIDYTIRIAKKISLTYNAKIGLSTDDEHILLAAKNAGLDTKYLRPDFLATDNAGKVDTIKDLLIYEESIITSDSYDYILDLDITSPLRTFEDITEAFDILENNKNALNLFSVNPANRNPYFNMVEEKQSGFFHLVKKNNDGSVMTRQSAPAVFELNASFYWYRREFFNLKHLSPITERSLIYEMKHICFDLDHQIDFEFLEFLITNNKIDNLI